ncbi:MAG: hypothetical protein CME10_00660 [Gemmatimonadetes bacterium]|jgi:hypothetical protein|nr:hypothetical protein [Gemmatimonadota bacterium]
MGYSSILKLIFLLQFFLSPCAVFSASQYPSNMDLLVEMVEVAVGEVLGEMTVPIQEESPVFFLSEEGKHDANWLVEHVISEKLIDRGFAVVLDSTVYDESRFRLSFRILDMGIIARSGLRGKYVDRQSRITLMLKLNDELSHSILWQDEITRVSSDKVPKSNLELLQYSDHTFAETELEEQSWNKFVEPMVVSSVLGGLIYLFFSNR